MRLLHNFKFCIHEWRTNGLDIWVNAYLLILNLTVARYVYNQKYVPLQLPALSSEKH
jgi:uncharacterized membrane protein (UPF0136 family)